MPVTQGTAARRRRLRIELRAERDRTGLTQDQVAEAMDWSQSKLIRIESGAVGISTNDLRALLALYNVTDPGRIEMITNLAKAFRERAWWEEYRDVVSKENQTFIGLEAEAGTMRYFQPLLIPGVGAQGGDAVATVKAGWRPGAPIIVNSSRDILYASSGTDYTEAARREALKTRDVLQAARG